MNETSDGRRTLYHGRGVCFIGLTCFTFVCMLLTEEKKNGDFLFFNLVAVDVREQACMLVR